METVRVDKPGTEVVFGRVTRGDLLQFELVVEADLTGASWIGQFRTARDPEAPLAGTWDLLATVADGQTVVSCTTELNVLGTLYFDIVSYFADEDVPPSTWCWGHAFVVPRVSVIPAP